MPLLFLAMAACDTEAGRLHNARNRWRDASISDYSFRYQTTGFAAGDDLQITVVGGAVTDARQLTGEFPVSTDDAPTIETLFDRIDDALDSDRVDVSVTYDDALGFPVHAYFDGGEEGDGFAVRDFTRAP